jgi:hypothetical protein
MISIINLLHAKFVMWGNVYIITTNVTCAVGPSVTASSTDFSFQNLGFWNLFEFLGAEII